MSKQYSNQAEIYNKVKAIAFSIYNRDGYSAALKCVENNRYQLDPRGFVGLKAELSFFHRNMESLQLTPAWDYGIKCDFSGMFDGRMCRFDVTTNLDVKKLSDYESIQKKTSILYKLALVDPQSGELLDIVDINFPFNKTGNGRLFDVLIFNPGDRNDNGEDRYNPYQEIYRIDSYDPTNFVMPEDILTDWYIQDIHSFRADTYEQTEFMDDDQTKEYVEREVLKYMVQNVKFISKVSGRNIVACGQRKFVPIGKDGDGEYTTMLYWQHPVIDGYLPDDLCFEI